MNPRLFLRAGLMALVLAPGAAAMAQGAAADPGDADFAYAQCVRDHGYAEFPDPEPDGFRFLVAPGDVARFREATEACRDLAPPGMRDEDVAPERLDALLGLARCIRENGVPAFPDPDPEGGFDLSGRGIEPDARLDAAMAACANEAEAAGGIAVGG